MDGPEWWRMLPVTTPDAWTQSLELPSRLFPSTFGGLFQGVELYEEDEEFVLACDMPGFDLEEITVSWDEGVLYISGAHEDEGRGRRQTFHRSFRFPKDVDPDAISARYQNGVLEVRLPLAVVPTRGQEIQVTG